MVSSKKDTGVASKVRQGSVHCSWFGLLWCTRNCVTIAVVVECWSPVQGSLLRLADVTSSRFGSINVGNT